MSPDSRRRAPTQVARQLLQTVPVAPTMTPSTAPCWGVWECAAHYGVAPTLFHRTLSNIVQHSKPEAMAVGRGGKTHILNCTIEATHLVCRLTCHSIAHLHEAVQVAKAHERYGTSDALVQVVYNHCIAGVCAWHMQPGCVGMRHITRACQKDIHIGIHPGLHMPQSDASLVHTSALQGCSAPVSYCTVPTLPGRA